MVVAVPDAVPLPVELADVLAAVLAADALVLVGALLLLDAGALVLIGALLLRDADALVLVGVLLLLVGVLLADRLPGAKVAPLPELGTVPIGATEVGLLAVGLALGR